MLSIHYPYIIIYYPYIIHRPISRCIIHHYISYIIIYYAYPYIVIYYHVISYIIHRYMMLQTPDPGMRVDFSLVAQSRKPHWPHLGSGASLPVFGWSMLGWLLTPPISTWLVEGKNYRKPPWYSWENHGKSMVSGKDFPFFVNPLNQTCWTNGGDDIPIVQKFAMQHYNTSRLMWV